jgi:hypothetical protein
VNSNIPLVPYSELVRNTSFHTSDLNCVLFTHFRLASSSGLISSAIPTNVLYIFFPSPNRSTSPSHPKVLYFIIIITFNYQFTYYFQPHYGHGVYSLLNRNKYEKIFWVVERDLIIRGTSESRLPIQYGIINISRTFKHLLSRGQLN